MLNDDGEAVGHHRANYILERGSWKAVCRGCRWSVQDTDRRRAAALFRSHHREMNEAAGLVEVVDISLLTGHDDLDGRPRETV